MSQPWVEKYRPKMLSEVVHQKSAVELLQSALENQTVPHMLFYGPPGTGKTTMALIVARQLFGRHTKSRLLELNASDDRGIDVVRKVIKQRAAQKMDYVSGCPDFQLIILDEADCMTTEAQKALLRTMEIYHRHTRYIIICNYVSRIIGPLVSRCARIRFQSLPESAMRERIDEVCDLEGVQMASEDAMIALIKAAKGDLRRAIMLLQSAVRFIGKRLSKDQILEISGQVPDSLIKMFETMSIAGVSDSFKTIREAILDGYSAHQILSQFKERLLETDKFNEMQKARIFATMADVEYHLSVGADEVLQLLRVGSVVGEVNRSVA